MFTLKRPLIEEDMRKKIREVEIWSLPLGRGPPLPLPQLNGPPKTHGDTIGSFAPFSSLLCAEMHQIGGGGLGARRSSLVLPGRLVGFRGFVFYFFIFVFIFYFHFIFLVLVLVIFIMLSICTLFSALNSMFVLFYSFLLFFFSIFSLMF